MPYSRVMSREALDALVALLRAAIDPPLSPVAGDATAGVHAGQVPRDLPADALGVHPYAVVYASPGAAELRHCGAEGALTITWQITCVGGTQDRCLSTVDRVRAAMDTTRLETASGHVSGLLTVPPGWDPGPVRRDPPSALSSPEQPRCYVPLQYRASFAAAPVGS